jgi:hypothetical protein
MPRAFQRYRRCHLAKPPRSKSRRFIAKMLIGGIALAVCGIFLVGTVAVYRGGDLSRRTGCAAEGRMARCSRHGATTQPPSASVRKMRGTHIALMIRVLGGSLRTVGERRG